MIPTGASALWAGFRWRPSSHWPLRCQLATRGASGRSGSTSSPGRSWASKSRWGTSNRAWLWATTAAAGGFSGVAAGPSAAGGVSCAASGSGSRAATAGRQARCQAKLEGLHRAQAELSSSMEVASHVEVADLILAHIFVTFSVRLLTWKAV